MTELVVSWWLLVPLASAAVLYASVGHGGASAYLAIFVLVGYARPEITPVVLVLNLIVASLACLNYARAGHFSFRLLLPFIATSIPAAFIGGRFVLSPRVYAGVLGLTLLVAGVRFLLLTGTIQPRPGLPTSRVVALGLPIGGILGFLAGLVGIGGGIFLSPLLLLLGWAGAKQTAAVSAAFIMLNSASGLVARAPQVMDALPLTMPLVLSVFVGGLLGSWWGAWRIPPVRLQQVLGVVLLSAALKLLYEVWAP